jgi:hypothetical protein
MARQMTKCDKKVSLAVTLTILPHTIDADDR